MSAETTGLYGSKDIRDATLSTQRLPYNDHFSFSEFLLSIWLVYTALIPYTRALTEKDAAARDGRTSSSATGCQ
jgi:hypothetical protein